MAEVTGEATAAGGSAAPSSTRVRRPSWVAHVIDDEAEPPRAVLLHLPSGRRTALSDTGTSVWQVIVAAGASGATADDVGAALAPQYRTDAEVIAGDTARLIAEMLDGEWLEVVPSHGDGDEA